MCRLANLGYTTRKLYKVSQKSDMWRNTNEGDMIRNGMTLETTGGRDTYKANHTYATSVPTTTVYTTNNFARN